MSGHNHRRVLAIAMAIEGPHLEVMADSLYTLDNLRQIRWERLSGQEKAQRLLQARAVIDQMEVVPAEDGSYPAVGTSYR